MKAPIEKEIKQAYVKKIASGEIIVKETAAEVGVTASTVYDWQAAYRKYGEHAMPGKGHRTPEDAELRKLKERVKQLEAEKVFLSRRRSTLPQSK